MTTQGKIKAAFEVKPVILSLASLIETRPLKEASSRQVCYGAIKASIKETGLVQPLVVCAVKGDPKKHKILDGHLRYYALKELGEKNALCIISTDDERYTFDAQVNHINPIQRHKMIQKAVKSGLQPERIAAALNIDLKKITGEMHLLDGIHPEVVRILKDKPIREKALKTLRRVKPLRQIEMAENMCAVNNFTEKYAKALLMGTRSELIIDNRKPKAIAGVSSETIAKMEKEMESLQSDFEHTQEVYSQYVFSLTMIQGYLKRLLSREHINRYLEKNHPDILSELKNISEMDSLGS